MPPPPPRDRQAAELVQAPLSYPGIDDQQDDVLATGAAAARRPPRRPARTRPARPAAPPPPPPARTLTEEQQVTLDKLERIVVQAPAGDRAPAGQPVVATVSINWKNTAGVIGPWDPTKVNMRYGGRDDGESTVGPGPFVFRPSYTKRTLIVTVDVWSERRGDWKPTQIYKQDITAYCPVDMSNWLSKEEKHVVATLFSEGGSDARGMAPDELVRVMWCIEHRLQLLLALDRALSDDPRDAVAKGRLEFARGRGWGRQPTYSGVLTKAQFSGIGTDEYKKALEPARLIKSDIECKRLQMTLDLALGVMTNTIADPDAGLGNPLAPGCFYYMTKDKYEDNREWNAEHPGDQKFAPDWDKLPTRSSEKHYYWGIEPRNAFAP